MSDKSDEGETIPATTISSEDEDDVEEVKDDVVVTFKDLVRFTNYCCCLCSAIKNYLCAMLL